MTDDLTIPDFLRRRPLKKETTMPRKKKTDTTKAETNGTTNGAGPGHNGPPELTEDEKSSLLTSGRGSERPKRRCGISIRGRSRPSTRRSRPSLAPMASTWSRT